MTMITIDERTAALQQAFERERAGYQKKVDAAKIAGDDATANRYTARIAEVEAAMQATRERAQADAATSRMSALLTADAPVAALREQHERVEAAAERVADKQTPRRRRGAETA